MKMLLKADYKYFLSSIISIIALVISILTYLNNKNNDLEIISSSDAKINIESNQFHTVMLDTVNGKKVGRQKVGKFRVPLNIQFDLYNNSNKAITIQEISLGMVSFKFKDNIKSKLLQDGIFTNELEDIYYQKNINQIDLDSFHLDNKLTQLPLNIYSNSGVKINVYSHFFNYFDWRYFHVSDSVSEFPTNVKASKEMYEDLVYAFDISGEIASQFDEKIRYIPIVEVSLTTTRKNSLKTSSFKNTMYKYKNMHVQSIDIPLWVVDSLIKKNQ